MPKRIRSHVTPACTVGKSDRHQVYDQKRYADDVLGPVAKFRSSVRWQRERNRKLAICPLCDDPFHHHQLELGGGVAASGIHHIVGLAERLDLGLVEENLRPLCTRCHNQVERLYRRDRDAAVRLFLSVDQERALLTKTGTNSCINSVPTCLSGAEAKKAAIVVPLEIQHTIPQGEYQNEKFNVPHRVGH